MVQFFLEPHGGQAGDAGGAEVVQLGKVPQGSDGVGQRGFGLGVVPVHVCPADGLFLGQFRLAVLLFCPPEQALGGENGHLGVIRDQALAGILGLLPLPDAPLEFNGIAQGIPGGAGHQTAAKTVLPFVHFDTSFLSHGKVLNPFYHGGCARVKKNRRPARTKKQGRTEFSSALPRQRVKRRNSVTGSSVPPGDGRPAQDCPAPRRHPAPRSPGDFPPHGPGCRSRPGPAGPAPAAARRRRTG